MSFVRKSFSKIFMGQNVISSTQPPKAVARILFLIGCLIFLVAGVGYYYHPSNVFWMKYKVDKKEIMLVEAGQFEYVVYMGLEEYSSRENYKSQAILLENGTNLGPANAQFDRIAANGLGRYMFWEGNLYFSTSDNSDPRINGRSYLLAVPVPIPFLWNKIFGFLGLVMLFLSIISNFPALLLASLSDFPALFLTGISHYSTRLSDFLALLLTGVSSYSTRLIDKTEPIGEKIRSILSKVVIGRYSITVGSIIKWSVFIITISVILGYGFNGPDWEVLTTKHYWGGSPWFYGGYATYFEETPQGYRTIQREGLANYYNIFPFSEKSDPLDAQYHVGGFPATERLAVSFLVYVLIGLTGGKLDVWDVFLLLNILIWLSSAFLIYKLASIYFEDCNSAFFAALFILFYPAFVINFHGVKIQYLSVLVLLAGIYAFEKNIRYVPFYLQFVYFLALFFFGLFATGSWLYLCIYIFIRHFSFHASKKWGGIAVMVMALFIAQIALGYLRQVYELPRVEQQMSLNYGDMLYESFEWLRTWIQGKNVEDLKLLNYSGYTLFTGFLPLIIRSFFQGHWTLIFLSLPAWVIDRRTRMFIIPFVLLFFVGHGGVMLTGWSFHYGYLSAPAAMMLILTVSGFVARLASHAKFRLNLLGLLLLLVVLVSLMDHKYHANLYYGGGALDTYNLKIFLHYGGSNEIIEY